MTFYNVLKTNKSTEDRAFLAFLSINGVMEEEGREEGDGATNLQNYSELNGYFINEI